MLSIMRERLAASGFFCIGGIGYFRKQATDDRVIRAGVDAADYAKALLEIVQHFLKQNR